MWSEPTEKQLAKLPALYTTEKVKIGDKKVMMHFFLGSCDWYAVEFDGEDRFFGFAILNGDTEMAEWGYFSLAEIKDIKKRLQPVSGVVNAFLEVDRDVHWKPKKAREIERIVACSSGILEGGG